MTNTPTLFGRILTDLGAMVAQVAARECARIADFILFCAYISRANACLERLLADWRAGLLPQPQPCTAVAPGASTATGKPPPSPARAPTSSPPRHSAASTRPLAPVRGPVPLPPAPEPEPQPASEPTHLSTNPAPPASPPVPPAARVFSTPRPRRLRTP